MESRRAVGGITDKIADSESGLLPRDQVDLETFGRLVTALLVTGDANHLAENARRHVSDEFLPDRHLTATCR